MFQDNPLSALYTFPNGNQAFLCLPQSKFYQTPQNTHSSRR